MTKPGFRKGRPGGTRSGGAPDGGDAFVSGALFSQAQILQLMRNEFARARRHDLPLGCILLQVDRISQLVDLHGAALRQAVRGAIAAMVRERTRGADLLGASNDDRYLLVLPHTDLAQTRIVAERLRSVFTTLTVAVDGRELALTLSAGIAATGDSNAMFFDSLVAQAGAALDHAAATGGGQVISFGELNLRPTEGAGDAPGSGAEDAPDRRGGGGGADA